MNIVGLAIETNMGLINSVIIADSPDDAVEQYVGHLEFEDGEVINYICADAKIDGEVSHRSHQFARDVEALFESAVPQLFTEGYFPEED